MSTNIIKNNIVNINMICMNIKERVLEKKNQNINQLDGYKEYNIKNLSRNESIECVEILSKDKNNVRIIFKGLSIKNIYGLKRLKLKGLDENRVYMNMETKEVFSGGALMYYGVNITTICKDNYSNIILKAI